MFVQYRSFASTVFWMICSHGYQISDIIALRQRSVFYVHVQVFVMEYTLASRMGTFQRCVKKERANQTKKIFFRCRSTSTCEMRLRLKSHFPFCRSQITLLLYPTVGPVFTNPRMYTHELLAYERTSYR